MEVRPPLHQPATLSIPSHNSRFMFNKNEGGLSMKTLITVLSLFFLSTATDTLKAQSYWHQQMSGTEQPLYGIYFTDANTGTAVGTYGTILKTTDGGKLWVDQNDGTFNAHLFDVAFINSDTGIVVGIVGTILRTTDGGENWTSQTNGIIPAIFSVAFADENNATAVGHTGIIMRTTDGGVTWVQKPDAPTTLRAVRFTDVNNGFAVGDNGLVMRTIDGGDNWFEQLNSIQVNLQGVYFTDSNTGTVVGGNNLTGARIYRTTNAGNTWTLQYTIPNVALTDVYFTDSQTGAVVGWDGIILSTSDAGTTWVSETSNTSTSLISVFFLNSDIGYATGGVGTILIKADSAVTNIPAETFPNEFVLKQNYPNPFNPVTIIKYSVPKTSYVSLIVYNIEGREIKRLVEDERITGDYNVEFNGSGLSSGIYFYKLTAGEFTSTKKLILMK